MKKPETVEWPAFDSPERIQYPDRPPLPPEYYEKAKKHFTFGNFNRVKAALVPPKNFDLLKRLRRAVYDYYFFSAVQAGRVDIIRYNPPKVQAQAYDELIRRTADYLEYCESNPGLFLAVIGKGWVDFQGLLRTVKRRGEDKRSKVNTKRTGPSVDDARRGYQYRLLLIFEAAKHERMTSRTDAYQEGKPYGPAFDFFKAAFGLIGVNLANNSLNKYLKETIRGRDIIKASKVLPY